MDKEPQGNNYYRKTRILQLRAEAVFPENFDKNIKNKAQEGRLVRRLSFLGFFNKRDLLNDRMIIAFLAFFDKIYYNDYIISERCGAFR